MQKQESAPVVNPTPNPAPQKVEPNWNDEELDIVGRLAEWADNDPSNSADPDDITDDDEKTTIADVLKAYAKNEKIPLDRAVEVWCRGSGLTGKSSWADWIRFNASNE